MKMTFIILAVVVYIGGRLGPDELMTGWVTINAIIIAGLVYAYCTCVDAIVEKCRANRDHGQ